MLTIWSRFDLVFLPGALRMCVPGKELQDVRKTLQDTARFFVASELKKRASKGNPLYHFFLNSPATNYRILSVPMVLFLQKPCGAEKHFLLSLAFHCVSMLTPVFF